MEKGSQNRLTLPYRRRERKYILVFIMALSFTLLFNTFLTTSFAQDSGCNCVVFRLDDIQDYWLNKIQMEVINTFKEKNIDLTTGVIGNMHWRRSRINILSKDRIKE